MAIQVGNSTKGEDYGLSITISHSLSFSSGNNRLVVALFMNDSCNPLPTHTVTYNGITMTEIDNMNGNYSQTSLHYILDANLPSGTGSYNVVGTLSGSTSDDIHLMVVEFKGVKQQAPYDFDNDADYAQDGQTDCYLDTNVDDSLVVGGAGNASGEGYWDSHTTNYMELQAYESGYAMSSCLTYRIEPTATANIHVWDENHEVWFQNAVYASFDPEDPGTTVLVNAPSAASSPLSPGVVGGASFTLSLPFGTGTPLTTGQLFDYLVSVGQPSGGGSALAPAVGIGVTVPVGQPLGAGVPLVVVAFEEGTAIVIVGIPAGAGVPLITDQLYDCVFSVGIPAGGASPLAVIHTGGALAVVGMPAALAQTMSTSQLYDYVVHVGIPIGLGDVLQAIGYAFELPGGIYAYSPADRNYDYVTSDRTYTYVPVMESGGEE